MIKERDKRPTKKRRSIKKERENNKIKKLVASFFIGEIKDAAAQGSVCHSMTQYVTTQQVKGREAEEEEEQEEKEEGKTVTRLAIRDC